MRSRPISVVLLGYVLVGFTYAATTPVFEASDELWHYPIIRHLATGGALPLLDPTDPGPWRQESGQPPLYYFLMAMATGWIDTGDMGVIRWLNPHVDSGVITADGNINLAIHTEAEYFPWTGTVLAVRLIRLLSVLMGAGTVYLTYRLALEIRPQWQPLAVGAAGVVAFTPMFVFISGAVNNDNLAVLLASWTVYIVARMGIRGDTGSRYRFALNWEWNRVRGHVSLTHGFLGVLLGLGSLTKLSVLTLLPIAAAVIAYNEFARWWDNPNRTRPQVSALHSLVLALQLVVTFGITALIAGWWYIRNVRLYGTPTGLQTFVRVLGRRAHP
ncbi:MAG TPA: phospholipid carrier-dependent glycosyltransferase, partial [Myxococcales bacterium]|nr:phospholipid carrier-dependent glycosyltransferase [Myxococcales bacterium]